MDKLRVLNEFADWMDRNGFAIAREIEVEDMLHPVLAPLDKPYEDLFDTFLRGANVDKA
jgi:hypothetical protein